MAAALALTANGDALAAPRGLVLDSHLDTPEPMARPGFDLMVRHREGPELSQVDVPRMKAGGLNGGFFVIFTPQGPLTPDGYAEALAFAVARSALIRETAAAHPRELGLAVVADDAARLAASGRRVLFQSLENSYPIGDDVRRLSTFHRLGVRMVGIVHVGDNQFADSSLDSKRSHGGLSPLGRALVAEANRLGMLVDASHASDEAFDQVLALSKSPIVLSHTAMKALYDHPRNLDDARLRALASRGGVVQVTCVGEFMRDTPVSPERSAALAALRHQFGPEEDLTPAASAAYGAALRELDRRHPPVRATFDDFMAHLEHAIAVVGVDHVGIGADWDGGGGAVGFDDIVDLPKVVQRLRAKGMAQVDIDKIMGGNLLRLLRRAEAAVAPARR